MKKAPKLNRSERLEIQILTSKGYSVRAIARAMGRSPNTVSAELGRNRLRDGTYEAQKADHKSYVRRKYAKFQGKKIHENKQLQEFITKHLQLNWSPSSISGHLQAHPELGIYASKTAIYEWLRSTWGQDYCVYTYSRRQRTKKHKANKTARVMIPSRVSIYERPLSAEDRSEAGHWEYDSVVSSKRSGSTAALAVIVERTSRFICVEKVPNLKPAPYAETIAVQLRGHRVRTLTTDNGQENRYHKATTLATGAPVYFTEPYSSWQKGGVEHANKLLRWYFPKGTDFSQVSDRDVTLAVERINKRPRKILGYKSALEVAKEKGIILPAVS